ncbi:MAG: hypothetical protein LBL48_11090 [Azoarcus sp.]|jgi:hypothetical protein|nr:hypothetical protein [Azoarcus sp.]
MAAAKQRGIAVIPRLFPRRARGGALLAIVILLLLAASATLAAARHLLHQSGRRAEAHSAATLAEARAALLGYAIGYPELHPGQRPGYLPCPDNANTGSAPGVACHARGLGAFGRFPYRTLGLPIPADGRGQCLWYAVSGSFKHNPKALTLNWDSPGQFEIVDTAGRTLGGEGHSAVAVLIAPGPPLPGQERPPAAATMGAQRCPGSDNPAADLPAFLDRAYGSGFAEGIVITHGLPGSNANDIVAWLTVDDIFNALRLRPDFPALIDTALDAAATALQTWLDDPGLIAAHAETIIGDRAHGRFPGAAASGVAPEAADIHDNWRDQLRFVACTGETACLTATLADSATSNASAVAEACRAIVLFGGERLRGDTPQRRRTDTERADPAQYLEGENLASYTAGAGGYNGFRHYTIIDRRQPASEDIVRCIP